METAQHTYELELVRRLAASDPDDVEQALEQLYHRYGPAVLRLATCLTGSRFTGARVLADVFIDLARQPPAVDRRRLSVRAHLFESALSACMAEIGPPTAARPAPASDDNGLGSLARLPLAERLPIALALFGGLTYAQVAQMLGATSGNVLGLMDRGMRRLLG